jgi:tRNA dimethylallyltransferase
MGIRPSQKLKFIGLKMLYPVNDPLVVVIGPTAVGKTQLAYEIAQRMDGEIVSADSRLFYRGMDIGTAKPSLELRKKIPHHLIDFADPDESISLRVFQQKADDCIQDIISRKRLPILVGGTGQYIHAVIEGWTIPPQTPDRHMRCVLNDWTDEIGAEEVFEKLKLLDPAAAAKMDYRNQRRTVRALEVILGTGRLFSAQRKKIGTKYSIKMIGLTLPREQLYQRIDDRIENMLANGFVEEVKKLLEKGFSSLLPSMSAIGYREIASYLQKTITLDDAIILIKRRTRQYVRRQANWFKSNDPDIHWISSTPQTFKKVMKFIQSDEDWLVYK